MLLLQANFSSFKKKPQKPNIFTFMVSEFRKYRTELKKALKWPPLPQRKKREEKLVMSWSPCECLTADVTQLYTSPSLVTIVQQPGISPETCCTLGSETPPRQHTPIPPWTHQEKKLLSPSRPRKQTPKPGRGKGTEEECNSCPAAPLCRDRAALPLAPRHR